MLDAETARAVASDGLPVRDGLTIAAPELSFTFVRSSGPGGQNVNKVNTKARLRWNVGESASLPPDLRERFLSRYRSRITGDGEFLVTSQRYRDQAKNAADCLEKLRAMVLAVADPPVRRKKTRPSRAAKARRLADKRRRSQSKLLRRSPGADE